MKYLDTKKILQFLTIIFLVVGLYYFVSPRGIDMYYYYGILDSNKPKTEVIASKGSVDIDLHELDKCKVRAVGQNSDLCFLNFYKEYTEKYGPEKALSHLDTMMEYDSNLIPGCHYITHGIGEGAYHWFGENLAKGFNFNMNDIFKNIGSCGNGFFHGITIELTAKDHSDDDLYNTLVDFCKDPARWGGLGEENCNHGVGHAVTIYYDHNRDKSVAMCNRLFAKDEENIFGCYTGVMMEYGQFADYVGLFHGGIQGLKEDCYGFPQGTKVRQACVVEGSGLVRYGENYIQAGKDCQQLVDYTERKACTKLTVIHAIRLGRSQEVKGVCNQLARYVDRIECTAFWARYLASAVDISYSGKLNIKAKLDVCHTLDLFGYIKCKSLVSRPINTFESDNDFGYMPNLTDLKIFLGFVPNTMKNSQPSPIFDVSTVTQ